MCFRDILFTVILLITLDMDNTTNKVFFYALADGRKHRPPVIFLQNTCQGGKRWLGMAC
jgi:hypothetical protein